jgi:hypothetical protein
MFVYLLFVLPALFFAMWAQWKVKSSYSKYAQVRNMHNMSGIDVARTLMRNEGLEHVSVERIAGDLTDHYDPQNKVMRLSDSSQSASVAAMAIVAHELGHAAQDKDGYAWLQVRSGIVPLANIGSQLGTVLFMVGFLLMMFLQSPIGMTIAWLGVILFSAAVAFTLVTLPVEFNASSRAREMLTRNGLINVEESRGVKNVLDAAALTYIAAAAQAIAQLLYFVYILGGFRRD